MGGEKTGRIENPQSTLEHTKEASITDIKFHTTLAKKRASDFKLKQLFKKRDKHFSLTIVNLGMMNYNYFKENVNVPMSR